MPTLEPTDWSYVIAEDPLEAAYWATKWDVTVVMLREAVARVGKKATDVEQELRCVCGQTEPRLFD